MALVVLLADDVELRDRPQRLLVRAAAAAGRSVCHGWPVSRSSIHAQVGRVVDAEVIAAATWVVGLGQHHELDAVDDLGPFGREVIIGPATSTSDWPFRRVGGVEVHQLADPVGGPVGDAGDHHAAVAVARPG